MEELVRLPPEGALPTRSMKKPPRRDRRWLSAQLSTAEGEFRGLVVGLILGILMGCAIGIGLSVWLLTNSPPS